jgi:hypothetical protein
MKKTSILAEYLRFLSQEKKYWMIPLVLLLVLIGMMVVLFEGTALAPFIYTIF